MLLRNSARSAGNILVESEKRTEDSQYVLNASAEFCEICGKQFSGEWKEDRGLVWTF